MERKRRGFKGTCHSITISLSHNRLVFSLSLLATPKVKQWFLDDDDLSDSSTASAGISIGGIVASLSVVDESPSPPVSSAIPPLSLYRSPSRSPRRFRLPLDLLDDSAYPSLSMTAHSTFLSGLWLSSTKSNRNQKLSFSPYTSESFIFLLIRLLWCMRVLCLFMSDD